MISDHTPIIECSGHSDLLLPARGEGDRPGGVNFAELLSIETDPGDLLGQVVHTGDRTHSTPRGKVRSLYRVN